MGNRKLRIPLEFWIVSKPLLWYTGEETMIGPASCQDRIVKNFFRKMENPCICPPEFPVCICGKVSVGKAVPRKAILPSKEEQEENPRSKSAKLRVFEKY